MALSVAMITLNAEGTIAASLDSLKGVADEIVVIDSGSHDRTVDIATQFGARVYFREWQGFGGQKNLAIHACESEWVLVLDSDEVLDLSLILEIKRVTANAPGPHSPIYILSRRVVCFGKKLDLMDRVPRLFAKGAAHYDQKPVHEQLVFLPQSRPQVLLSGFMWHHTYRDLSGYFAKFDHYTSLGAQSLKDKGRRFSIVATFSHAIVRFIRLYLFKGLLRNGFVGFQYALLGAFYTFVKYAKLRECSMAEQVHIKESRSSP